TLSKTVVTGRSGLSAITGNKVTPISASYSTSDYHTLVFTADATPNDLLTIAGSEAIVDRSGNSIQPFTLQYPTGAPFVFDRPGVTSVTPRYAADGVFASAPIVLQFNKPMDPASVPGSVRVTQNG